MRTNRKRDCRSVGTNTTGSKSRTSRTSSKAKTVNRNKKRKTNNDSSDSDTATTVTNRTRSSSRLASKKSRTQHEQNKINSNNRKKQGKNNVLQGSIGTFSYDNGDEDKEVMPDDEEIVEIPELEEYGFDFDELVDEKTARSEHRKEDKNRWVKVAPDHCSKDDAITENDAKRRCKFLGKEETKENIEFELDYIQSSAKGLKKSLGILRNNILLQWLRC